MENKLLRNLTSALLVVVMVMSIVSIPVFTGNSKVDAAISPTYTGKCKVTLNPPLAVNGTSTITATGYELAGVVKLVPRFIKVSGSFYSPTYSSNSAEANTFSATATIDYPDNYVVTTSFWYYTWNSSTSKWRYESETYINTQNYFIKPKLVLNANKGKVSGKSSITRTVELTTSLKNLTKPQRKGFTFTGWYASAKGYSSEKVGTGYYLIVRNLFYKNATSKTVYAQWKKKVKVKFNAVGGKVKKKSKKVTYVSNSIKKSYGSLPKPKKSGKVFAGWYTKKKGGKYISKYSDVTKSKNHTIYAHWY